MIKAQQLELAVQQYVLAANENERQKIIQKQIPGSQPHYFLSVLQEIKLAQLKKQSVKPDVKKMINDYNHNFGAKYSKQFVVQEFLLEYSQLRTDKQRKAYFKKFNEKYMFFKSSWEVQPPQVKKLAGSDMKERNLQKLSSKLPQDKIPKIEDIVKKLHSSRSNFLNCDVSFFPYIDFHQLQKRISNFISQRSQYIPHLESNKSFIPALAAFLDKHCHRSKNIRNDAESYLLEPLTLQQLDKLGNAAPFLPKEDKNFIGIRFSKVFHGYLDDDKQESLTLQEQRQNLIVMYEASKNLPATLRSKILIQILKNGLALNNYSFTYFIDYLNSPTSGAVFKKYSESTSHWDTYLCSVQKGNHSKAQHADSSQNYSSTYGDQQIARKYITYFLLEEIEAQRKGNKLETAYFQKFKDFIDEKFLLQVYNETRLKAGLTLPQGAKLESHVLQKIQNQVLIRICQHNKALFLPEEGVELFLEIKNVNKLYVKVFEINTQNYYKKYMAPFKTDVNLDGLVSTYETIQEYSEPPSRQFIKSFKFDQLKGKIGLFVFQFIGNGISSRAVVKKGSLSLIHKATSMGHQAYVLDEHRNICKGSGVSIFIQNEEYQADEQTGRVVIPYSRSPGQTKAILKNKNLCQLADFMRISQEYTLQCQSLILPESLIMGAKANLLLVPHLLCNGRSASLTILKKCTATLQIHSINTSIPTTQQFNDLKLENGKELALDFTVPPNLTRVNVSFNCEVFNLTSKSRNSLSYKHSVYVDSHNSDYTFYQLYLKKQNNSYNVYTLGKNGEPKSGYVLNVSMMMEKCSQGNQMINIQLATDQDGKIELGPLNEIQTVTAKGSSISAGGSVSKTWSLPNNKTGIRYPFVIDCIQNEKINLPFLFSQVTQDNAILLKFDSKFKKVLENKNQHLKISHKNSNYYNGIQISGLTYGFYSLRLPDTNTQIQINVHSGKYWEDGFILTFDRILENKQKPTFLKISDVELDKGEKNQVTISVQDGVNDGSARIHAFAFQFLPPDLNGYTQSLRSVIGQKYNQEHFPFAMWKNFFLSNRQMGDEFRYVFDRKNQKRFVGNTLDKPKMMIKRNFLRDTTFAEQSLKAGRNYAAMKQQAVPLARIQNAVPPPVQMMQQRLAPMSNANFNNNNNSNALFGAPPQMQFQQQAIPPMAYGALNTSAMNCIPQQQMFFNFQADDYQDYSGTPGAINGFQNFLAHSLVCASNLKPNSAGKVSFSCNLQNYSGLFIIALDHSSVTHHYLQLSKKKEVETRRLDLLKPLKMDSAYAELRKVTNLQKHDSFIVNDLTSSQLQFLDSLEKIAQFLVPQINESSCKKNFQDFSLLKWPILSENEKHARLSKHFSHEFNLFIWAKDREFFNKNIKPMIRFKCEKTLIDYFLLNDKDQLRKYLSPSTLSALHPLEKCLLISAYAQENKENTLNLALTLKGYGQIYKPSIEQRNKKFDAVLSIGALLQPSGIQSMIREEIEDQMMSDQEDVHLDQFQQANDLLQIGGAFSSGSRMQMSMRQNFQEQSKMQSMRNVAPRGMPRSLKKKAVSKRSAVPVQYEQLEQAKQYAETHYYGVTNINQFQNRTKNSLFWGDLALHLAQNSKSDGSFTPNFLSQNFVLAINSFTQLVSVLTFLDLPYKSPQHGFKTDQQRGAQIKAADQLMIYAKDLKQIEKDIENNLIVTLRISEGGQSTAQSKDSSKIDQLLLNQVYTAQVVVTNVSPILQQAQLLFQIPECSIPLDKTPYHKALPVKLQPYHNFRYQFAYYFPKEGSFQQAPISLSVNGEKVIAQSKPLKFNVVSELQFTKAQTFRQIIATGDMGLILKFLKQKDLIGREMGFDPRDIYYFLKNDEKFWRSAIAIYRERQLYDRFMWSLGFFFNDFQSVCELLSSEKKFKKTIGSYFRSQLINVDPDDRDFRLLDYHPLVNKRAHKIGGSSTSAGGSMNRILNKEFAQFYNQFIMTIAQKPFPLSSYDRLNLVYYLLLQDRVDEALDQFKMVDAQQATREAEVQYDYMRAFLDFYTGASNNYAIARQVAMKYEGFPVISWKLMFDDVRTQIKELDGEQIEIKEPGDEEEFIQEKRKAAHIRGVASEPQLIVTLESKTLSLDYLNIGEVQIKYYPVDLQLLFSREPFLTVQTGSNPTGEQDFSYVKPALTEKVQLSQEKRNFSHQIIESMIGQNMIIEIVSGKKKQLKTYFATSLMKVMIIESYGEIKVNQGKNGNPLPKVYVKVFSKKKNSAEVSFHKDGYTDIRGRFDYASISGGKGMKDIEKFAILVMSDELGSLTKEAKPPSGLGKKAEKI